MSRSKLKRDATRALEEAGYEVVSFHPVRNGHYQIVIRRGSKERKITMGGTPKNPNAAIDNMLKALRRYVWPGKK